VSPLTVLIPLSGLKLSGEKANSEPARLSDPAIVPVARSEAPAATSIEPQ
jgi:hypothetical protein